ncbi:Cutinase 3 [Phlyctema vagabunda]|uniref:Cutinase n=1 Tax=Phlyctema vagabunda TaxID=108571 RepID=A0ABR4PEW0_9HELO
MAMQSYLFLVLVTLITLSTCLPQALPATSIQTRDFLDILNAILEGVPGLEGNVNDIANLITTTEQAIADAADIQITYNELSGPCKEYTIIFARGTSEPGNVGVIVGPPFFEALKAVVGSGNVAVQGVNDYPAEVGGFLEGGDPGASAEMAVLIQDALNQCPNTHLVVSGYSQGGQVVHDATALLSSATAAKISSVVIFGDPDNGTPVANVSPSKVLVICHDGDNICEGGALILLPHLTYATDAVTAAGFVVAASA